MSASKKITLKLIYLYLFLDLGLNSIIARENSERFKALESKLYQQIENAHDKLKKQKRDKLYLPKQIKEVRVKKKQPIKIEDIKGILLANNQELAIMKVRIEEAKFNLRSKVASWYPNINISGTGLPQYLEGHTYNELATDTKSRQWKASLSATVRWDLINPSRHPDISIARDQVEKSRLSYKIKLRELHLEALNQYFLLQKSLENIRISKQSILTSEESLKEALSRFESGVGTKLEVLEAKTQLSKDKQRLVARTGEKKINERSLAQILNLDETISPAIGSNPKVIGLWSIPLEESIIAAYFFSDKLNKSLLDISISNNKANSMLGKSQPKLSIFNTFTSNLSQGEVGVTSPDINKSKYSQTNTIGLQFDWKIFDGGLAKSNYDSNKKKSKELQYNFSLNKAKIRKEVEESFFNLETAKKNIGNSFNEVLSASESLRLGILRLQAGITTQREVVNHQRDLTQAEVNYIMAITDYNTNLVRLKKSTGIEDVKTCSSIKNKPEKDNVNLSINSNLSIPICPELLS